MKAKYRGPVKISELSIDPDIQSRAGGLKPEVVAEYAERRLAGDVFLAVTAFQDDDGKTWLAEGFYRVASAQANGDEEIESCVYPGDRRDALLCSLMSNREHGLPRTDADKRRSLELLFGDPEWRSWSVNAIAEKLAISWNFVDKVKRELKAADTPTEVTYERDGETRTMDTSKIGRTPRPPAPEPEKPLPLRGSEKPKAATDQAAKPESAKDGLGHNIPKKLADAFASTICSDASRQLSTLSTAFKSASWLKFLRLADVMKGLDDARQAILDAAPWCVHMPCGGKGCDGCRHAGYLPEWRAEELKLTEAA